MNVSIRRTPAELGEAAAGLVAERLELALHTQESANLLVSTGASQFETLKALAEKALDWRRVTMYHLDEYAGIDESHPASFRRYLKERFVSRVNLRDAVLIDGMDCGPEAIARLNERMKAVVMDVGIIGIGENAHIAFNDPPADFEREDAYHLVALNEACKKQQVGEGWFASVDEVPAQAISMTCRQILTCKCIVSPVPFAVKAAAIKSLIAADHIDRMIPATLLLKHPDCSLFLDAESASLADPERLGQMSTI